jgi:hypothetical protein
VTRVDTSETYARVRTILEHAADHAWTIQDIGLLGLRLDARPDYRLHVWAPSYCRTEPPVHDHPFDFASTVVAGEITNVRFDEDPAGIAYHRVRYSPSEHDVRRTDTVRLSPTATTTHRAGDRYRQASHELHATRPTPGTVTIIRMAFRNVSELTVCSRGEEDRISDHSRRATPEEVHAVTATALEHFSHGGVDTLGS